MAVVVAGQPTANRLPSDVHTTYVERTCHTHTPHATPRTHAHTPMHTLTFEGLMQIGWILGPPIAAGGVAFKGLEVGLCNSIRLLSACLPRCS